MIITNISEFKELLTANGLTTPTLCVDSRDVVPGAIFFAMRGTVVDGYRFIDTAIENGAAAIVSDRDFATELPLLLVPNLNEQAAAIAHELLDFSYPNIIGVTGTNGKTSIANWLAVLMANNGRVSASIGTLGVLMNDGSLVRDTGLTTPGAVDLQHDLHSLSQRKVTDVVMEVSSHALEQGRVNDVAIKTAVFTNLTRDHLDYHGTMQDYFDAKSILFAMPEIEHRVINIDDVYGQQLFSRYRDAVSYGLDEAAFVRASQIEFLPNGVNFELTIGDASAKVHLAVLGAFNVSNALAVAATLYCNGVSFSRIAYLLSTLRSVAGRMELVEEQGISAIVDYAHTPDALEKVLTAAKVHTQGKLWCVFGCGGDRDRGKRALMAKVVEKSGAQAIVTADNNRMEDPEQIFNDVLEGFVETKPEVIYLRQRAIDFAINSASEGDIVLIAGKGHEPYIDELGVKKPWSEFSAIQKAFQSREGAVE